MTKKLKLLITTFGNILTETEIQHILFEFANQKNHRLVVDNCKALNVRGEADLISITRSNLIHEFEIKRTKSDFDREFQSKSKKHTLLEGNGNYNYSSNYFWFVAPDNVLEEADIPNYAGFIEIVDGEPIVKRKAPRLHNNKATDRVIRYLERGITLRYWGLRDRK